jgi:NitT/TauT family transport system ATP-binding protein
MFIEVRNISKTFRSREAGQATRAILDAVDFTAEQGEIVSLLGPSGCGKTTLLRIIAGLIQPDQGSTIVNGEAITRPRKDHCMVFQNFGLLPWRTVEQNIAFPLELDHRSVRERKDISEKYLELVNLRGYGQHFPHEISGGMQQRVGIARALVRNPRLLLMDEPFGALDAQTREQLQKEFMRIVSVTRNTVIFVTHSIEEALILSDRIVVFTKAPGRIKAIIERPEGVAKDFDAARTNPRLITEAERLRDLLHNEIVQ